MFKKYLFVFKFSLASSPLKHQLTFNDLVKKAFGNMMGVVENACRLGLMKNRQLVSPSYKVPWKILISSQMPQNHINI